MSNAKNSTTLCGVIVSEVEKPTPSIYKFRLAVDYAGEDTEKPDDKSGYFNITYFVNDNDPNGRFVKSQVEQGNFKVGTGVILEGRLKHRRFLRKDETRGSEVTIIANSIDYSERAKRDGNEGGQAQAAGGATAKADVPDGW